MGALQTQLTRSAILEAQINYLGVITEYDVNPLTTAMLKGLLTPILKEQVNFVNAPYVAADQGIKVVESKTRTSENFASLIMLKIKTLEGENIVSGTIFGKDLPRIIRINNFYLEAIPEGHILFIQNEDRPGVIGLITTTLGNHKINISRMHVGEEKEKRQNIILLTTSTVVSDNVLAQIRGLENVHAAKRIEL
jgi:D-3-phosphoglycerate dehydrogenase